MRRLLLLTALVALTAPAAASADPKMWNTPSGNIRCGTFENLLRCDITDRGNPPPPRPASCEFDYGSLGVRKRSSKGFYMCVSDAVAGPGFPTLRYGTVWRRNGFRCTIKRTGVRCTNRRGHGFFVRRGLQKLF